MLFCRRRGRKSSLDNLTGARYVGAEPTSYDGSTKDIAGYALIDASAGYSFAGWTIQLNSHNLFNRRYYINNYDTLYHGNAIGAPFNAALMLRHHL